MRRHLVCAMVAALAGCAEPKGPVAEPPVIETAVLADDIEGPVWRLSDEPISDDGKTRSYALIDVETGKVVEDVGFCEMQLPIFLPEQLCTGMATDEPFPVPKPVEGPLAVSEPATIPPQSAELAELDRD